MSEANRGTGDLATRPAPPGAGSSPTGREVVLARTFDAPRALVFRAWTDPAHLARWWGPACFTNPVCEVDPGPGGRIRIHMAGPDGAVYPMGGVFHEVVEPERIVFTSTAFEDSEGRPALEARNTVTFEERDGRTTVTVRAVVVRATPEMAGAVGGMGEGWAQSLEKLGAVLAEARAEGPAAGEFLLTRDLDAPRDLVFRAWTEPDRLARWWGPKGFELISCTLDLRPGGVFHYGMRSPDGQVLWGRWTFREVVPPGRLVFVASFSDEQGGVTRHPFAPDWPREVLSTVTFAERGGRTTLTMRGVPLDPTESERRTFEAGLGPMGQGWAGTLGQLDEFLAKP